MGLEDPLEDPPGDPWDPGDPGEWDEWDEEIGKTCWY